MGLGRTRSTVFGRARHSLQYGARVSSLRDQRLGDAGLDPKRTLAGRTHKRSKLGRRRSGPITRVPGSNLGRGCDGQRAPHTRSLGSRGPLHCGHRACAGCNAHHGQPTAHWLAKHQGSCEPIRAFLFLDRKGSNKNGFLGGHVAPRRTWAMPAACFQNNGQPRCSRKNHRSAFLPSDSNRSKYPIVCRKPSRSATVGSQPSFSRANVMFG